jgi:hypothetical protein
MTGTSAPARRRSRRVCDEACRKHLVHDHLRLGAGDEDALVDLEVERVELDRP